MSQKRHINVCNNGEHYEIMKRPVYSRTLVVARHINVCNHGEHYEIKKRPVYSTTPVVARHRK
jgi:hypothetical protein